MRGCGCAGVYIYTVGVGSRKRNDMANRYIEGKRRRRKRKRTVYYIIYIYRYEGYPLVGPAHVFLGIKRKGELKQKQFMSVSTLPLRPRHRVRSLSPLLRSFVGYFSSFTTRPARSPDPLNPRKNVPWLLKVIRSCFYRTRRTGRARTLKQEPL